jgi:hypothetical protein
MILIGRDFHSRDEQIAGVDTETGDLIERRLEHKMAKPERSIVPCHDRRLSVWKQRAICGGSDGC